MTAVTEPAPMFPLMNSVVITPNLEVPHSSTSSVVRDTAQSFALPTKLGTSDFTAVLPIGPYFML